MVKVLVRGLQCRESHIHGNYLVVTSVFTIDEITSLLRKYFPSQEDGFSATDFIYSFGRASQAVLYSMLYMPELVEVGGSVLLAWNVPDEEAKQRFLSGLEKTAMSIEELEASFNFVEIGYLFDAAGRDTTDEEDELLAKLLANAWKGHLALCYPKRVFVIEVLSPAHTGSTVGLHFFEKR